MRFPAYDVWSTSENSTWPCSDTACRCRSWNVSRGAAINAADVLGWCRSWKVEKRELKKLRNKEGSILSPTTAITLLPLPSTERAPSPDIRHVFVNLSRLFYARFVGLIVILFDVQRRIRNEASND